MAWEHDPVIEKKKHRFLSLFLILMVKFPPLHVILIMRRYILVTVDINLRETVVIESRQWWKLTPPQLRS